MESLSPHFMRYLFFILIIPHAVKSQQTTKNAEIIPMFYDSLHIGKKGHNKIRMWRTVAADSSDTTHIWFYARLKDNKWIVKNKYSFETITLQDEDVQLSDFNNDGRKDMTYVSMTAARGANEVRKLFIYDKLNDKLIYMENSEDYPNMLYNKELNCIDAFLVYGGCMTVFLRIKKNRLVEFANVELAGGLTVTETGKNGKKKILVNDTSVEAEYVRYKNYKPLKEY